MNDFHPGVLEDTTHYIYGRIMAVKKRCCRDDSDLIFGLVYVYFSTHAASPCCSPTMERPFLT